VTQVAATSISRGDIKSKTRGLLSNCGSLHRNHDRLAQEWWVGSGDIPAGSVRLDSTCHVSSGMCAGRTKEAMKKSEEMFKGGGREGREGDLEADGIAAIDDKPSERFLLRARKFAARSFI
jgi:hypothetical protein